MRTPRFRSSCWLIALPLMLQACGFTKPLVLPPAPVEAARIPPLPETARQPELPTFCSPSCSSALTAERESWLLLLKQAEQKGSTASSATTR